ncbi:MAG: NAD(P)-binding protein [Myxococcota bacterium]
MIKVAILGGGMGSLAAAWRLSETAADRANYDVTVYQRDWLLGGKGASTHNAGANLGHRIEEHGIHLLLGFYNNALHLLRSAYAEVQGTPGVPPFDSMIEPWDWVWMADEHPGGTWLAPWKVKFPADAGVVPGQSGTVPKAGELFEKAVQRFGEALAKLLGATGSSMPMNLTGLGALVDLALALLKVAPQSVVTPIFDSIADIVDQLVRVAWGISRHLLGVREIRHAWIAVFLFGTNISGALRDRVLIDGTDPLDDKDYRDWLKGHSAVPSLPPHVAWESPPIRALYDLAFSRKTGLAAGVSLIAITRMVLGYEGHFTYKMKAGMGEVVFSPLYLALKQRGVKFVFFHEVDALVAGHDAGANVVEEIHLNAPSGTGGYAPTTVKSGSDGVDLQVWPAIPPNLASDPKSQTILRRGTDFDVAVLGISVGGLTNAMVGTLRAASPPFASMIDNATHVATQAMQLWMTKSGGGLGWPDPEDAMLISYERPFNSWVDMSHVLPKEDWPAAVKSVHYLCDELRTGEGSTEADVKVNATAWITNHGSYGWPNFAWSDLHDPEGRSGAQRMDAQYFRANAVGSDRYVTVGPDSVKFRLPAGASGFRNLALAGDWVRTQLSAGCLEAATTGGLDAGEAIRGGTVQP